MSGAVFPLPPIGLRLPGILFGHPNVMAGFLNLLLPIVFVRIIVRRSLIARITLIGTFCAFVAVEYFASSRGGWLGGAIGLAVTTIALTWSHGRNWIRPMWHRSRGIALGAGIGVIAILGVAGAVVFELLSAQASMTQHAPVSSARAGVWAGTVDIVSRSPWVGHGPDSFVVRFAQVAHLPPGDTLNHAHNVVLELAAEGGVIAVLLALGASGVGIWCLLPSVRSALQRPDPALAAYLGSFTAMLVQHGVDFLLKVEPYLMTVMVLAALLMSRAGRRGLIRLPARLLAFGCVFTAGAVLVASLPSPAETSFYLRGIKDGEARDWTAARHGLCTAAEQAPWVSIYRFECALAIASDSAMGTQDARLEDAVREQQAGLALDPTWPVHRANLAGMEWAIGQREVAIEDMRQAVAQAPRRPCWPPIWARCWSS